MQKNDRTAIRRPGITEVSDIVPVVLDVAKFGDDSEVWAKVYIPIGAVGG
jgi:hypothetical protein